jgi:hypothetical protein
MIRLAALVILSWAAPDDQDLVPSLKGIQIRKLSWEPKT